MKTLEEIGYSVLNQIRGHYTPTSDRIEIKLIYRKIADIRSVLLKEEYLRKKYLDPSVYAQECCLDIGCRELACGEDLSGVIEKFVALPALEEFLGEDAIKYFGSMDKKVPFARRTVNGITFNDYNQYTSMVPFYSRIKNEAILGNIREGMEKICVIGVFEDVLNICKPGDAFPLPQHLVHKLELLAIQQFTSTLNIRTDDRNDTRDEVPSAAIKK